MALIVEDGSGMANAESYISVDDAATYFADRGKTDSWEAVDDPEAALRLATDFMGQWYRSQWAGMRRTTTQALDWPRIDVPRDDAGDWYDYNSVPVEVRRACAELALRTVDGPLTVDTERATSSERVGEIGVTYFQGQSQQKRYEAITNLLAPLLKSGGSMFSMPMARA